MPPSPATAAPAPLLPDAGRLPTLDTPRFRLRWLEPADAPALLAVFGDAEVCRYWSSPALPDLAAAGALQREIAALFAARTLFQWGIVARDTDALVGTATLASIEPAHGRASVGYALARAAWGRGVAGEALGALVDFAFGELDLRRLEADVDPRNARSIRVLERAGFVREGCQRERYVMLGELQDAVLYGLLRREWA